MIRILLASLFLLSGCQLFVDFDRDLIDGGPEGGSGSALIESDAGVRGD